MTPIAHFKEMNCPSHDEIAKRAYEIYLDEGKPAGHAADHWIRAEKELRLPIEPPPVAQPKARARPNSRIAVAKH